MEHDIAKGSAKRANGMLCLVGRLTRGEVFAVHMLVDVRRACRGQGGVTSWAFRLAGFGIVRPIDEIMTRRLVGQSVVRVVRSREAREAREGESTRTKVGHQQLSSLDTPWSPANHIDQLLGHASSVPSITYLLD